nr:M3 family metallopeptidase [Spiroplasma clarkii]
MKLNDDLVPTEVYEKLLEIGKQNIQPLKDYYLLIKNYHGLKTFNSTDRELKLVRDFSKKYSIPEGKKIVREALQVLGEEYQTYLDIALKVGNIDYIENPNKVSGAYSTGAQNHDPVILMNWDDKLSSVSTLAHEVGHSVHTLFADKNNKFPLNDYPIILAEVSSTFSEHILFDYLLKHTNSDSEKIYLLQQRVFDMISTFYRQIQFAEFEYQVHKLVQEQLPLTADILMELYKNIENQYGYDLFDDKKREVYHWAYVSHFLNHHFMFINMH